MRNEAFCDVYCVDVFDFDLDYVGVGCDSSSFAVVV
jgi:hypothetical protein